MSSKRWQNRAYRTRRHSRYRLVHKRGMRHPTNQPQAPRTSNTWHLRLRPLPKVEVRKLSPQSKKDQGNGSKQAMTPRPRKHGCTINPYSLHMKRCHRFRPMTKLYAIESSLSRPLLSTPEAHPTLNHCSLAAHTRRWLPQEAQPAEWPGGPPHAQPLLPATERT